MNAIAALMRQNLSVNVLNEVFKIDQAVVSFDEDRKIICVAHRYQVTVHWDETKGRNVVTPQSVPQWHGVELPFTATADELVAAVKCVSIRGLAS